MARSLLSLLSDNHPSISEDNYHQEADDRQTLAAELKMLLSSRSRIPDIEAVSGVNGTILNYGFNESFSNITEVSSRRAVMVERIRNTLARFEPRLTNVFITGHSALNEGVSFTIQAMFRQTPVVFELKWDDCTGRFYFYE